MLLVLLGSTALSNGVLAQQAPEGAKSADQLETVIVTSQKRTENIRDVPYSVSAVGGEELADRHVQSSEDITREIPGISFGAGANPGQDQITIRGVSSFGGSATVGLYLDDVPIVTQNSFNTSYSGATEPKLFDLDRVEVLRGPQGTLYGSSSMGGTVRYITNQPDLTNQTETFSSDLSGTEHGGVNYDDSAILNFPIVPGVAAIRAGIDDEQMSGYVDHYKFIPPTQAQAEDAPLALPASGGLGPEDQSGVNLQRTLAGHLAGTYKPNQDWSFTLSAFGQRFYADDTSLSYDQFGIDKENKLVPERTRDTMFVPSLSVTGDLGWADLTSISSYFWRQNAHQTDGTYYNSDFIEYLADFYYADTAPCQCGAKFDALPGPAITEQTTWTTSEEFRLASKLPEESGIPISWIGGVFLSDRKIKVGDYEYATGVRQTFLDLYHEDPANSGFADGFYGDSLGSSEVRNEEDQIAGFGEATYYITPALKATAGLRYLYARTDWTVYERGYFVQGLPPYIALNDQYHGTTPKFALAYTVNDDVNVYVNVAKGYRLGGYIEPIQTTVGLCVASLAQLGLSDPGLTYKSDSLWSYEAGTKANLLDNHLSINAAGYYIDWSNVQQSFTLSCGSPYTANFGSAESYGGELEIRYKPVQGLILGLDAGATHATLTQVVPNVGATNGEKLLNVPDWTATFSGEYDWPLSSSVNAFARGDYDWVGRSHGTYNPVLADYSRPVYSVLNASVGIDFDNWDVSLYAKNLLNDQKAIQKVNIVQTVSDYTLRPLTVGLVATVKFGPAAAPEPAAAPPAPPPLPAAPPPVAAPEAKRSFQVFFDFDKSTITAAAAKVIQAAADAVKAGNIVQITVTGHTDTVGSAVYNQGLSERRAASVKGQLVADGVASGEITTIGVGKTGLLVPTADGVREPQNRRAEIVLQ
jgi:outer membrane receptor protein involved in Fe transport